MSLLDRILEKTRESLDARRRATPLLELQERVVEMEPTRSLRQALSAGFKIIGEVKVKSPSAGMMNARNVENALAAYDSSPAVAAVSILTDQAFFGGAPERLTDARRATGKPILRKDFIIDPYQVWEARAFGADAILLMATVHAKDPARLRDLYDLARSLELDALVEIGMESASSSGWIRRRHGSEAERLAAMLPTADIWGINSRGFITSRYAFRTKLSATVGRWFGYDFTTNRSRHSALRRYIPEGRIAVAESGIRGPEDLGKLLSDGFSAALIGTAFLKGPAPVEETLHAFEDWLERLHAAPAPANRRPAVAVAR